MVDPSVLPAIRAALRENEIGDQSPYVLSYARLGKSGGSFGVFQGDACVDAKARDGLRQALVSASVDAATVTRIVNAVSQPCPDGSPLSPGDQKTADDALNSSKGRAIVDAMDGRILQVILNELDSSIKAAQSVGRRLDPGSQLSIALWVNMAGAPTSLNDWLKGTTIGGVAPPAASTVTRDDVNRYLKGTKYFTLHPKNLIHFEASVDKGLKELPGAPQNLNLSVMVDASQFIATIVQTATAQWEFFGGTVLRYRRSSLPSRTQGRRRRVLSTHWTILAGGHQHP
jgi:hypothetical protein